MKYLLIFLLTCPLLTLAQSDSLLPVRRDTLKLIGTDLVPTSGGLYWRGNRVQYTYDGIDVRSPKDLGRYILASGNEAAIREFNGYLVNRQTGTAFVVVGSCATIGGLIMTLNANSNADSGGPYRGTSRSTVNRDGLAGTVISLLGSALIGAGWSMRLPGQRLRRAVQYYNQGLKQRQPGVSWKLEPYSGFNQAGIGLVGRF